MILFANDWAKYPSARPHLDTKNESFMNYAKLLKHKKVVNHAWPLALIDQDLVDIDPFRSSITLEEISKVSRECSVNPWYYMREIARFPGQGGDEDIPFAANRANMSMLWTMFNNVDYSLTMPRQTGKSGSSDQGHVYINDVAGNNVQTQIITKDNVLKKSQVARIKAIRAALPFYLQLQRKDDIENISELTTKALGTNTIRLAVGQQSEEGCDKVARGLTAQRFHFDEFPYIAGLRKIFPAAMAAATTGRRLAAQAGGFYGNIFTTTAGKLNTDSGSFAFEHLSRGAEWSESYLDSTSKFAFIKQVSDLCGSMQKGIKANPLINGVFSHRQLGYTDEWLVAAIANAGDTGEIIDRDFLNIWTNGSLKSPFSNELIKTIKAGEQEAKYTQLLYGMFTMKWFVDKNEIIKVMEDPHLICIDSSNAVGNDFNGLCMINLRDMSLTATSRLNIANLLDYGLWVAKLMDTFDKTTLVIENKSSGMSICDIVSKHLSINGKNPFLRIFNRYMEDEESVKTATSLNQHQFEEFYEKKKKLFGFNTTASLRNTLYDSVLMQAINCTGHRLKDSALISEILGLHMKNGRLDHAANANDDMAFSWVMGHWFVRRAVHHEAYGIDTSIVLKDVVENEALGNAGIRNVSQDVMRGKLLSVLSLLKKQLAISDDKFKQYAIKKKIKKIESMVGEGEKPETISEVKNMGTGASGASESWEERIAKLNSQERVSTVL